MVPVLITTLEYGEHCHLCIIVLHGSHTTLGKPDAESGFIFVLVCSVLELCKCLYKLDNFLKI
jgi:hypothetical protein